MSLYIFMSKTVYDKCFCFLSLFSPFKYPIFTFLSLCCLMVIYHIKVFTYENIALFIKRLFMTAASAIERFNFVAPKKQDVFYQTDFCASVHTYFSNREVEMYIFLKNLSMAKNFISSPFSSRH